MKIPGWRQSIKSWWQSSIAPHPGWLDLQGWGKKNPQNHCPFSVLFQEPKHENLFTECEQICCWGIPEATIHQVQLLFKTLHGGGHSVNSGLQVQVWEFKSPTDVHVWQDRCSFPGRSRLLLPQPGCRARWLPWAHAWPLAHAPRDATEADLAEVGGLEKKITSS